MSDLQKYIRKRKIIDSDFSEGFEEGYQSLKIGVLLKQAREASGLTQDEIGKKLHTNTTPTVTESCLYP